MPLAAIGGTEVQGRVRRRANRDYSASEFDANGDIVRGGKSALTKSDCQAGFASAFCVSDHGMQGGGRRTYPSRLYKRALQYNSKVA
jgi:hypothetical protein